MVQRSFITGSKWLYYKIYTGPKAADAVLTEVLLPILAELQSENHITQWFFIRYADPKHHLRLRFLVTEKRSVEFIIDLLHKGLTPLVTEDIVWKVQLDTYHRELERYGHNTMELSESIFYHDSTATLAFLNLIEGDEGEELRWLFGLRSVDNLLESFHYKMPDKLQLMERLKIGFGLEFNMSRPLKKQLDQKYRNERGKIDHFMTFTKEETPDYAPILEILQTAYDRMVPVTEKLLQLEGQQQLYVTKNNLLGSYIHMLMNRLFKSKNRLNEMVCYDFLFRYYKSQVGRMKMGNT